MSPSAASVLLLTVVVLAVVTERAQAQYFAPCWGWGPSCSRHNVPRHSAVTSTKQERARTDNSASYSTAAAAAPASSARSSSSSSSPSSSSSSYDYNRHRFYGGLGTRGIPSIVTSGGWEPGFGKRSSQVRDAQEDMNDMFKIRELVRLLRKAKQTGFM